MTNSVQVLYSETTQASHTGDTVETVLATYTLLANTLASNGMLRITALYRRAGSAGSVIANVRFGGISGTVYATSSLPTVNNDAASLGTFIFADNATNAQKGNKTTAATPYLVSSTTYTTSAIDTTSNVDIVFTGQLGSASDTVKLESCTIELVQ